MTLIYVAIRNYFLLFVRIIFVAISQVLNNCKQKKSKGLLGGKDAGYYIRYKV